MSYTPITWEDKSTLVNQDHMNEMEQALKDHDDSIEELKDSLAEKTDEVYATSLDDLCTKILSTSAYTCTNIYLSANCVNEITSGAYSGYAGYGFVGRAGVQSTIIDFFFIINSGRIFISGRISDGAVEKIYIQDNGT